MELKTKLPPYLLNISKIASGYNQVQSAATICKQFQPIASLCKHFEPGFRDNLHSLHREYSKRQIKFNICKVLLCGIKTSKSWNNTEIVAHHNPVSFHLQYSK